MKSRSSNDRITSVGNERTERVPPDADITAERDGDQLQAREGRILRIGDEAGLKPDLNEWEGKDTQVFPRKWDRKWRNEGCPQKAPVAVLTEKQDLGSTGSEWGPKRERERRGWEWEVERIWAQRERGGGDFPGEVRENGSRGYQKIRLPESLELVVAFLLLLLPGRYELTESLFFFSYQIELTKVEWARIAWEEMAAFIGKLMVEGWREAEGGKKRLLGPGGPHRFGPQQLSSQFLAFICDFSSFPIFPQNYQKSPYFTIILLIASKLFLFEPLPLYIVGRSSNVNRHGSTRRAYRLSSNI